AKNLDLAAELGWPAHIADDLSLTISLSGSVEQYQGHLVLLNVMPEQQSMRLEGDFVGNQQGLKIAALTGTAWGGNIGGNLELAWDQGLTLHTRMQGRQLDPAKMTAGWQGIINIDVSGNLVWPQHQPVQATINAKLLDSRLHGQVLQGEISAQYVNDDLLINNILLRGRGFVLHAAGKLNQRVAISANITDLALLMPAATGALDVNGWVRWRNGQLGGAAIVNGQHLALNGIRVNEGKLDMQVVEGKTARLHLVASLQQVVMHDRFQATAVVINGDGTLLKHTYTAVLHSEQAEASLEGGGSYQQKKWYGQLTRFSGHDSIGPWNLAQPTTLSISASNISLASFILTGLPSERLELSAELARDMAEITAGEVRATWSELNLARASNWLQDIQFAGSSSGAVSLNFAAGQMRTLQGTTTMAGTILRPGWSMSLQRSEFNLHGDQQGLHAEIDLHLDDGGNFKGNLSASLPAHLQWPDAGKYALEWNAIDLALLQPWLSSSKLSPASTYETRLQGKFSGRAAGHIFSGQRFDMEGRGEIAESLFHWRSDGEVNVNLRSAEIAWQWKEMLHADWTVVLAQLGQIHGDFQLPIPARFPLLPEKTGAVQASVIGQVQEHGTITTLFPGLVQESEGQLDVDLKVSGQWQAPLLQGKLQLSQAAAYLPTTGIHVKDMQLNVSLEKNIVRIDSFQASSGPGRIQGTALLTMQGTKIIAYQGTLDGERFQTVYFPELQVLSSPHLTFNGSADKLVVRGEIQLPELHIMGPQANAVVLPSKDVIVEGTAEPDSASSRVLDAQIKIVLGDEVTVHAKGMDAKLSGSLDLVMASLDKISSKGEIRIVQGSYQTYGVNLDIVRGHLFYSDGPVDEPTLDILALRTIGDVRAGVTVTGTLKAPITKLYSEPAMPDVDILAYIVLGHPLDSSREQESLITLAANALLSSGQSAALQDQVKHRLGLGDVEIQVVGSGRDGHMGYKAIPVNPPGIVSSKQEEGLPQAMITVGKYVTPKIYISYGRSLFTGGKMFFLRYDISRRWQVETQTGGESGVDMYYKIEFN
ncbi:MAG: translocation/assembly module TamB domain-containing protein, partial [Gallionellaceae bacterium]|nr:translocation/assembly module TamB domain-containing protein [Gallionellaceae bacterium]